MFYLPDGTASRFAGGRDDELGLADIADGKLPHFLSGQRPPRTAAQAEAEARTAHDARGAEALQKVERKEGELNRDEFVTCAATSIPPPARNCRGGAFGETLV